MREKNLQRKTVKWISQFFSLLQRTTCATCVYACILWGVNNCNALKHMYSSCTQTKQRVSIEKGSLQSQLLQIHKFSFDRPTKQPNDCGPLITQCNRIKSEVKLKLRKTNEINTNFPYIVKNCVDKMFVGLFGSKNRTQFAGCFCQK